MRCPGHVLRVGPYVVRKQIVNHKLIGIPKLPTDDSMPINAISGMTVITPVHCDRQLYTYSVHLLVASVSSSNIADPKGNTARRAFRDAIRGRDFRHLGVRNLSFL